MVGETRRQEIGIETEGVKTRREVVGTRGLILESPGSFSGPESCKFCVCHICLRDQSFKF